MSEFLKCPNCESPVERTFQRCPVCEETLVDPITFERQTGVHTSSGTDSFRLRWQRNETEQNRTLIGPWNGAATSADLIAALQQDDALRAKVLRAVLPSAEELAGAIYETDSASWDHALPWERAAKATQAHYFTLGLAAHMAALGTLGVTE